MGLGVINKVMPAGKYKWKAFCETTSTRSDWVIGQFIPNADTEWKAIDKVTGAVIDSGIHPKNKYNLHINLSNNSNGVIIYLKVDKNGNGVNIVLFWSYNHELNWIDIDVLPMLRTFLIGYNSSQYVDVRNARGTNQINSSYHYSSKFKNIDFINNSEAFETLNVYGNTSIENNQILNVTKWKSSLRYLRFDSENVGYDTFNFSDFTNLQYLYFYRNFNLQDTNGTNILLPKDTLRYLSNYKVNILFPQFGVDPFPLLYYFYIYINKASYDYNKLLSNGNLFPGLYQIYINNVKMAIADTLVKDFPKLGKFTQYGGVDANGAIEFRNNPKLWYPILNGTKYTNVILDTVSQQAITRFNYVYPYASLDLSQANLLAYIQYSHRLVTGLKLNIRNGNNQNLAQFVISKYYEDSCIICDDDCFDSNGDLALPIMVNADKRAGDVFTTDPNDANCPT